MIKTKLFLFFVVILEFPKLVPADSGQTRIVGGSEAVQASYPYMVSFQKFSETNILWFKVPRYTHFCAGTLIQNKYILTAGKCFYISTQKKLYSNSNWKNHCSAHCVASITDFTGISIYAGVNNLMDTSGQRQQVLACKTHPNYAVNNVSSYDVAICKVAVDFTINSKVALVPLTPNDQFIGEQKCLVAGWGSIMMMRWMPDYLYKLVAFPNDLQQAIFTTINNTRCNKEWPE